MTADPTPIGRSTCRSTAGVEREPLALEADVVVVGSGAGGGVVAADLSHAGRSVVVLEAGRSSPSRDADDELDAFDRLYLNHGFNVSWDGVDHDCWPAPASAAARSSTG